MRDWLRRPVSFRRCKWASARAPAKFKSSTVANFSHRQRLTLVCRHAIHQRLINQARVLFLKRLGVVWWFVWGRNSVKEELWFDGYGSTATHQRDPEEQIQYQSPTRRASPGHFRTRSPYKLWRRPAVSNKSLNRLNQSVRASVAVWQCTGRPVNQTDLMLTVTCTSALNQSCGPSSAASS